MGHLKTVDGKTLPDRPMRGHSGTQRLCRQGTTPLSIEIRIKRIVHIGVMVRATFERNATGSWTGSKDGPRLPAMKCRFASWNVNNRNATARHFEILQEARPDILALQEASQTLHSEIASRKIFAWGSSSLELWPPRKSDGRSRRLGCSLFAHCSDLLALTCTQCRPYRRWSFRNGAS